MIDPVFESFLRELAARYPQFRLRVETFPDPEVSSPSSFLWVLDVPEPELCSTEDDILALAFDRYADGWPPFHVSSVSEVASQQYFPRSAQVTRIAPVDYCWTLNSNELSSASWRDIRSAKMTQGSFWQDLVVPAGQPSTVESEHSQTFQQGRSLAA